MLPLGENLKSKKRVKNDSTSSLKMFCAKSIFIGKIRQNAWAIAFAKCLLWVKNKIQKNMSKTTLQAHLSCSVQKRFQKKPDIRKMRTILKIGKTFQKRLYKHILVVLCKKRLQKTPSIRKMSTF